MSENGWLKAAWSGGTPKNAALTALVVGPILTAINQGDTILAGDAPNWLKLALTFIVPYCVATVGAVSAKSFNAEKDQAQATVSPVQVPAPTQSLPEPRETTRDNASEQLVPLLAQAQDTVSQIRDNAVKVNGRSKARAEFMTELTGLSRGVASEVGTIEALAGESHAVLGEIGNRVGEIVSQVHGIAETIDEGTRF